MKPGPEVTVGLLAGRASSWSLAAGSRDPRADAGWLVVSVPDMAGCGVQGIEACVGLLLGRAKTLLIPGLCLA